MWRLATILNRKIAILAFILIFLVLGLPSALSVPAAPINHTLEQKDGSKFIAKMWGDERSHGWETTDGYSIIFDEIAKNWTYAIADSRGNLVSSGKVVGTGTPPGNIPKHIRQTEKTLSRAPKLVVSQAPPRPERVVSSVGTANIPVILINFTDRSTTYTTANFNTLLFGTGVKSMKDFYEEVSYGVFSVSSGPGGVAGWYTASKNHDYYGENELVYPYSDMWPGTLVREAVAAADTSFIVKNVTFITN